MKKFRFSAVAIIMALAMLFTACSPQADQGDAPKKEEKPKELSVLDVIDKSSEVMDNSKGFTFDTTAKQKITVEADGQKENIDVDMNMEMNMTNDPVAMQLKGKVSTMGMELPMEMYILDNVMYQKIGDFGWEKAEGVNLGSNSQTEKPSESLKQLAKLLQKIGGKEKTPEGITMTKEEGTYVVEVDFAALKNEKNFEKELLNNFKASMGELEDFEKEGMKFNYDQMAFESYKHKLWIDEKTFQYKKMTQEFVINIPAEQGAIKVDQKMELNLKGEFTDKIEVPEEAKK